MMALVGRFARESSVEMRVNDKKDYFKCEARRLKTNQKPQDSKLEIN